MHKALRHLLLAQVLYWIMVVILLVLEPKPWGNNLPLSYYGTITPTVIPFAIGTLVTAFLLFKSANELRRKKVPVIQLAIRLVAVMLIALLATPYSVNSQFWHAHMILSGVFASVFLFMSAYIVIAIDRRWLNIVLTVAGYAVATASILSFSFIDVLHFQASSQFELLGGLIFTLLLYNTLKDIADHPQRDLVQ